MPAALTVLFCTPQDVYELIGVNAAQLALDDQNQASGQEISATAAAAVGATSITVAALQYPLLRGARLVFQQAQMDAPVEVTLSAAAAAGATTLTVVALTTAVNSGAIANDNGVNVWLAGLLSKACKYATARVMSFCNRYDPAQLVNSWDVNNWATVLAAKWVGTRLFRAAPEQIQAAYEDAMDDMKRVQSGQLQIAGIAARTMSGPFMSNVTMSMGHTIRRVRVEPTISEPTPTQFPQAVDYSSIFSIEF